MRPARLPRRILFFLTVPIGAGSLATVAFAQDISITERAISADRASDSAIALSIVVVQSYGGGRS